VRQQALSTPSDLHHFPVLGFPELLFLHLLPDEQVNIKIEE
jgi:hypothetical protein